MEFGTLTALPSSILTTLSTTDGGRHAFHQANYKGFEGEELEELYCHYREMSKATGARKPSESQKAKAL